jgi:hypothetical protein
MLTDPKCACTWKQYEESPYIAILTSTKKNTINVYTLSSTKLEIRTKQFLLGSEGVGERGKGWGERDGVRGRG